MNQIRLQLEELFKELFCIDMSKYSNEDMDRPLTSKLYGLHARNLVYLFFEVEKKFKITIQESDITELRFDSFNNILKIIESNLEKDKCLKNHYGA